LGRRLEVGKKSRGRERRAEIWEEGEENRRRQRELSRDVIMYVKKGVEREKDKRSK
jgi:hypothetical protein